jgi:hypothetical protein
MPRFAGKKERKMKFKKTVGLLAALLALALLSVALVISIQHGAVTQKAILWALTSLSVLAGAVTVTYKTPVSGLTAPTAAQVYGLGLISAVLEIGDTDTSAVITHNFGLDANELASRFPIVVMNPTAGGTVFPQFTIAKATNSVTLTKASASGTGGSFDVFILRPHTNQIGVGRQNF